MASAEPLRVYWDTSLLLRYLTGDDPARAALVRDLLHVVNARESPLIVVMSALVRAEIFSRPENDPEKLAFVDQMFFTAVRPSRTIRVRPMNMQIALRAAAIAGAFEKITTPDAIHLATAIEAGASHFWTYDGDRDKQRNRSGGLISRSGQIEGLIIEPPILPAGAQRTLIDLSVIARQSDL